MFQWLKRAFEPSRFKRLPNIHIYHFTHIRQNLSSIVSSKSILSFEQLILSYGWEKALSFVHDTKRYDFLSSGRDYVNFAIGRAPSSYLYRLSGKNWRQEWVAIEISSEILNWQNGILAPHGAASTNAELLHIQPENWKTIMLKCFQPKVNHVKRPLMETLFDEKRSFPVDVPTHPNCELLLPKQIDSTYWTRIIAYDNAVRQTVRLIIEKNQQINLKLDVDKFIFLNHPATPQLKEKKTGESYG